MSRKLSELTASFRSEISALVEACKVKGVEMRPYFTLRTPREQAKLWRQSRSTQEIKQAIADLESAGAPYLAQALDEVGPQHGVPVTNALPGNSWHQWGEAVDCYWLLDEKAEWSTVKKVTLPDGSEQNGYHLYAELAERQGLTPGGFWTRLKDWPHVQARADASPRRLFSWNEIDVRMKKKFESA